MQIGSEMINAIQNAGVPQGGRRILWHPLLGELAPADPSAEVWQDVVLDEFVVHQVVGPVGVWLGGRYQQIILALRPHHSDTIVTTLSQSNGQVVTPGVGTLFHRMVHSQEARFHAAGYGTVRDYMHSVDIIEEAKRLLGTPAFWGYGQGKWEGHLE